MILKIQSFCFCFSPITKNLQLQLLFYNWCPFVCFKNKTAMQGVCFDMCWVDVYSKSTYSKILNLNNAECIH